MRAPRGAARLPVVAGGEWGALFSKFKNRGGPPGLAGFAFDADGVGVADIARRKDARPRLLNCRFIGLENGTRGEAVAGAVRQLDLRRRAASAVIDADGYRLLLVEAPDVAPDEMRGAIRWRIKDLIDFHIDDAVIDVFEVPGQHSTAAGGRLMYAVAARGRAVRASVDALDGAGVALKSIDIPEMCLRNVAALLPEDVEGVATLYLAADHGLIVLTRQHVLYLARRIDTGYASLDAASGDPSGFETIAGSIVLELQRSLDYYESHFRQGSIGHVAVAPSAVSLPALAPFIDANLNARVADCDLNNLLDLASPLDATVQGRCLPALGAALRVESAAL
jgi:MSHA biogenesis protein MshI